MKYNMKHARNETKGIKHGKKEVKKEKKGIALKRKTVLAYLGIIALLAVIIVVIFYFQPIYKFVDSKISALGGLLFGRESEEEKETGDKDNDNTPEVLPEDEPPEVVDEKEDNTEDKKEEDEEDKTPETAPTIKIEIYEGPLYAKAGDICYYRIKANVTGEPHPEISFSIDDSLGSLGTDRAQVNIKRDKKTRILTAVAENSEGKASDTITLVWNCNVSPEIKGITLSSSTLYVGKKYDVSVDAVDPDGDELSYSWSADGGSITDSSKNPTKWNTPDAPGDYILSVTVSDGKGNSSGTSITAYVGEVTVEDEEEEEDTTISLTVPRKEGEGGYIEYGEATYNGGSIYAGDSDNNKPCSGFVSFDISGLKGSTVQSAALTLAGAAIKGDPLSFFTMLNINVLSWGERPIKQDDFKTDGIFIAGYNSPGISCNVSKLKEELQKAINEGKSRFQIRIHFSGPYTNNNDNSDGWRYTQANVNLNVTAIK